MLNPSMQELMKRVGNRYLLVNLAAQRARDIADEENEDGETTVSRRRMDEFDDEELDDGDIPEEDR